MSLISSFDIWRNSGTASRASYFTQWDFLYQGFQVLLPLSFFSSSCDKNNILAPRIWSSSVLPVFVGQWYLLHRKLTNFMYSPMYGIRIFGRTLSRNIHCLILLLTYSTIYRTLVTRRVIFSFSIENCFWFHFRKYGISVWIPNSFKSPRHLSIFEPLQQHHRPLTNCVSLLRCSLKWHWVH